MEEQVLKGLVGLFRLEREDASVRGKHEILRGREEHRRRMNDSMDIVASTDSGAEGALSNDEGPRVGHFKRQRLHRNYKNNDGDAEVTRNWSSFDNEVTLGGFAVARSGGDKGGYEFLLVRKPSRGMKRINANIHVKAKEEIMEKYRRIRQFFVTTKK